MQHVSHEFRTPLNVIVGFTEELMQVFDTVTITIIDI